MRNRSLRRPRAVVAGLLAGAVLGTGVSACEAGGPSPSPPPSSTAPTERPFTVLSTDPIRVADPVAVTEASSTVLSQNVFQRLMTSDPGEAALKPDAARDCPFTAPTVVTCTLNDDLFFHNGHELTSSDVRFSVNRAARLGVPGSSAALLSSLRRIDTPDPRTVRFVLSRPDSQFGWALASPAASIVDEEVYDADQVRPPDQPIIGSGPLRVDRFDGTELRLLRYEPYVGRTPARTEEIVYRTVPDSPALEDAMARQAVDVVWRGLDTPAVTRLTTQIADGGGGRTADGYRAQPLEGVRVRQLFWAADSPRRGNAGLRQAISVALQTVRTSDSVVPVGVPGHVASLPIGGRARPRITWSDRIRLTLSYDPTAPDARDVATQVRSRLEDTGGLSVRLQPGDAGADLSLVDRRAWTPTPLAWLQPYLDAALPERRATLTTLEGRFRASTAETDSVRLVTGLQRLAATDATVLPLSQGDETMFARDGVDVPDTSFGPGWQLGLWGMRRV